MPTEATIDNSSISGFEPAGMFEGRMPGEKDFFDRPDDEWPDMAKDTLPASGMIDNHRGPDRQEISSSSLPTDTLVLLITSVLVLVIGLLIAVKIKH